MPSRSKPSGRITAAASERSRERPAPRLVDTRDQPEALGAEPTLVMLEI